KYGNMRTDDQRDQWLVVKHNGRKLLKNRETGHYMNIADMPDGHIQATALSDLSNVDETYIWSGKNIGGGTYLLSNVTDKVPGEPFTKYISIQNLTKYAEYSVINPNWGSPQWKFLPVGEKNNQLYRFRIPGTEGQYLQDERTSDSVTEVTYGPADDEYSIWFLDDKNGANGPVMMKNMGSGRYLSIQNLADAQVENEDEPELTVEARSEVYDTWGSIKWKIEHRDQDEVNIRSGWTGHYLYATLNEQGKPVFKVSRAEGAADRAESIFIAESAQIAEKPLPDGPVRIKSVSNHSYLYENSSGVVLYGDLAADNGYSHWMIEQAADGVQRIQNRVTGNYLTLTEDYTFVESKGLSEVSATSSWAVKRVAGGDQVLIRSQYGDYDDEFIHVQNNTGYAERGLYPDSWGSVQWELESAPLQFNTPNMDEERNLSTATPVQNDTNVVLIAPQGAGGKVLAEQSGKIKLINGDDANAASKWILQDFNGRHLIKNTITGHYLGLDSSKKPTVSTSMKLLGSQWILEDRLGYRTLSNAVDTGGLLQYNMADVSYGARGSSESALWNFTPVASDVVYAAADAFKTEKVIRFAVHAQEAGEYTGQIRYKNNSGTEQQASLTVNGLGEESVLLQRSSGLNNAEVKLNLREGMNTVSLSGVSGDISALQIDSLIVKHSLNKSYRGATVPYVSYEAEDAKTNGVLIGPSRKYRSIASEASGRQAVQLKQTGDYIEFPLAEAANSLVVRYSIPDSKDGKGDEQTLSLYVNGQFKQSLRLTSKYAWEYGSYPWSNDPRQGSGHRFFDEIHTLIGDVPQGAVIRLQKDARDQADSYIIDLVDMEHVAPAYEMPDGFVSVTDFGAVPNDGQDDTMALRDALAVAKDRGTGVWFPAGSFDFGDQLLDLDSAVIRGAGMWYTTLNGAKFFGHGGTVEVYDLLIDGGINERDDEAFTNAFHGAFGPGSIIQQVWIEHTKAGLWLTQPIGEKARTNELYMMGLRIRNLMADGINFAVGTTNSMMEQSDIRYPGDDGIAMWSFTDGKLADVNGSERTPSVNNTARFNTVTLPWLADNIVVFGGKDNKIQDNVVKDTVANGTGIAVSTRFNAEPFTGTTVVERNTLLRTGSYDTGFGVSLGALWLFAGESDMKGKIVVQDNVVKDSTYAGLIAHGDFTIQDVLLKNIVIDGTGTNGVDVTSGLKGSATVDNVIIRGDRMKMVSNPSATFSFKEINEGFASGKKPPVDPGEPSNPGSGGGDNQGTGSSGGPN
ncbi:MAG TPA: glycosyl hydrolase family 28-related protein, partial [Paenibacillus sp.]